MELTVSEVASFLSPELEPGHWEMRVTAREYADVKTTFQIPHKGEWTNMRVRMESLRSLAIKPYRELALSTLLPSARLWDFWTPRETLTHDQQRNATPIALDRLTGLVEAASYARPIPSEKNVEEIKDQTSAVLEQLGRAK